MIGPYAVVKGSRVLFGLRRMCPLTGAVMQVEPGMKLSAEESEIAADAYHAATDLEGELKEGADSWDNQ
jgi:hypothetical protein